MTGGWIKLEKSLENDPRVLRMARAIEKRLGNADVTLRYAQLIAIGALVRLWMYADTHLRDDDTLDVGPAEIDQEIVGLPGFCDICPDCWLQKIDDDKVKLPGYQEHNGTTAKRREKTRERVARHRERKKNADVTRYIGVTDDGGNAEVTRLDQDQEKDQEKKDSPLANARGAPAAEAAAQALNGHYAELERQILAAYAEMLPELPQIRDWNERRRKKLRARIAERVRKGKPADTVDYWRGLFSKVAASDFLMGRRGDWRCPGLEWLLEPKNFTRLIEGGYDNNRRADGSG